MGDFCGQIFFLIFEIKLICFVVGMSDLVQNVRLDLTT